MAARENQGYLIAVIILVLLTLVLALAAFLGMSKASENSDSNKQLNKDLEYNKKLVQAYELQANILKALAGDFGPAVSEVGTLQDALNGLPRGFDATRQQTLQGIADEAKSITESYNKDMAGTSSDDGGKTSWRQHIRNLIILVGKKNDEADIQVKSAKRTLLETKAELQNKTNAMSALEATNTKLLEDVADANARSLEKEKTLKNKLDEAVDGNDRVNREFAAFRQQADEKETDLGEKLKVAEADKDKLKTKLNQLTRKVFDRPDGTILKVASALRTVYIDLGSVDGLTNNQTFSVYDKDVTNFEEGQYKAMVEVTKVFRDRAEARINLENPTNPILTGDHILTATWDPGYAVEFALAGRFDLDGDIYDDTQRLVQMINRNGGKVVAWHDDNGNIKGKVDSSVRFLVIGDPPVSGANSENPEAARAIVMAMQQMKEEAVTNTVEEIDLQKLLNRMGVRAKPKTIQYEKRIGGFRERNPSDTLKNKDN
ncbi:MAG: hypothetical protein P8J27_04355 [Mariniblastus sp.]|nr:hypothetical protein [Mariniblastus sp.]